MKIALIHTGQQAGKMVEMINEILKSLGLDVQIQVVEYPKMVELEEALKKFVEIDPYSYDVTRRHQEHCRKLLGYPEVISDER